MPVGSIEVHQEHDGEERRQGENDESDGFLGGHEAPTVPVVFQNSLVGEEFRPARMISTTSHCPLIKLITVPVYFCCEVIFYPPLPKR